MDDDACAEQVVEFVRLGLRHREAADPILLAIDDGRRGLLRRHLGAREFGRHEASA